jgi:hypothetical protein
MIRSVDIGGQDQVVDQEWERLLRIGSWLIMGL